VWRSFVELPAVVSCWSNLTQNVFAQVTPARMAAAILACLVLQLRSNAAALPAFHHAQRGPFGLRHAPTDEAFDLKSENGHLGYWLSVFVSLATRHTELRSGLLGASGAACPCNSGRFL
jgi:hypothetical protein